MTLCTLRAATVLSRDCRADFGRPLTKKVTSHSRDGPGVTAPLRTNIVPLTGVWNPPPLPLPPLKKSPIKYCSLALFNVHSSTPTPVFLTSREEAQTMVREKLGPKPRPPQTLYLPKKRRNSDHGLSFWGGKTQTMV